MRDETRWARFLITALALILISITTVVWLSQPQGSPSTAAEASIEWRDTLPNWLTALFAGLSTLISLLAVVYVRQTLSATWKAVKAAEDGVQETKRIGEAQTRAYLHISEANYDTGSKSVQVQLKIKNNSPTPALAVTVDWDLMVDDSSEPSRPYTRVGGEPPLFNVSQAVAASDMETYVAIWDVSGCEGYIRDLLSSRPDKLILKAVVHWRDVYGKRQRADYLVHGDINSLRAPGVRRPLVIQLVTLVDVT
jgi:hypothetical protein